LKGLEFWGHLVDHDPSLSSVSSDDINAYDDYTTVAALMLSRVVMRIIVRQHTERFKDQPIWPCARNNVYG